MTDPDVIARQHGYANAEQLVRARYRELSQELQEDLRKVGVIP